VPAAKPTPKASATSTARSPNRETMENPSEAMLAGESTFVLIRNLFIHKEFCQANDLGFADSSN
jgi:hypothetical protein